MRKTTRTTDVADGETQNRREGAKKKRPKQRGRRTKYKGIKRLPDGRFWIRARVIDPKTDERREREGIVDVRTVEQAHEKLAEWRSMLRRERIAHAEMILSDCAKLWLKHSVKTGDARSTREARTEILEQHVLPDLGRHFVQRLDRHDFTNWILAASSKKKRNGEPYGEETVRGWWRMVRAFVRWVVEELDLEVDPTSKIDPRRYMHKDLRRCVQAQKGPNALTAEELRRFLEKARQLCPQHYAMLVIGFFTGMRWSELSALRWDDFDVETMQIRIDESQWRGTSRKRTKAGPHRTVAFDEFMWSVMQEHRQRMIREQTPGFDSGLCFPSETGGFRYRSVLDKPFAKVCDASGIEKALSSKCFRRTYNDLCRQAEVRDLVLRAMIGHSDARMSEVYATIDPSEKRKALAQVMGLVRIE